MRVVIDTNILVSAFLSPSSVPARLFYYLERGSFVLLVSEPILAEYRRALRYRKVRTRLAMSHAEVDAALDDLCATAVMIEVSEPLAVVPMDPDDDKFFECAVAGGATYIISGDAQVLAVGEYRGIHVLSARLFLHLLEQGLS